MAFWSIEKASEETGEQLRALAPLVEDLGDPYHLHGGAQPPTFPAPVALTTTSGLWRHSTHIAQLDTNQQKSHKIKTNKSFCSQSIEKATKFSSCQTKLSFYMLILDKHCLLSQYLKN